MRIFKYLISSWAAIVVYTLLMFFYGPKGISAYNQLLVEKDKQYANLKELEQINKELEAVKQNLLYDQDTLTIYARQIGYAPEDEMFIRIVGLAANENTFMQTGKIYVIKEPSFTPEKKFKTIAIIFGLFIFSFFFVMDMIETKVK